MVLDADALCDLRERIAGLETQLVSLAGIISGLQREARLIAEAVAEPAETVAHEIEPLAFTIGIVGMVAHQTGIDPDEIFSRNRTARVSWVRQLAIYVLHRLGMSTPKIGWALNRDHSTCVHAIQRIRAERKRRPGVYAQTEQMLADARAITGAPVNGRIPNGAAEAAPNS